MSIHPAASGCLANCRLNLTQLSSLHLLDPGVGDAIHATVETPLEVLEIFNDRYSYFLTFRRWATNFDKNRAAIIARFGEFDHPPLRLYLLGGRVRVPVAAAVVLPHGDPVAWAGVTAGRLPAGVDRRTIPTILMTKRAENIVSASSEVILGTSGVGTRSVGRPTGGALIWEAPA